MLTKKTDIWGLILTGGKSRRMGQDKALLNIDGNIQLHKVHNLLKKNLKNNFVSVRAEQAEDHERKKYNQIIDRYDDMGPLAGIISAMQEYPDVNWLVVACDLINLDQDTIHDLLINYSPECNFISFRSEKNGLPEPLCAIYNKSSRQIIEKCIEDKVFCPRKILINYDAYLIDQPNPDALENFNKPDDINSLRK